MANLIEGIKLIGGISGLITISFKLFEEISGYLKIKVQVSQDKNICVLTEVENTKKILKKKIENAFLIISPEDKDILEIGNIIAKELRIDKTIESTNQFELFTPENPIYINDTCAIIPLQYYFSENIHIADETLSYCCSVDKTKFSKGNYSVRFYIFCKGRYHRSTQDLLTL
jgi:hypothetical protein